MDEDRIAGALKTVLGNVKESVGKIVGDQKLTIEGTVEKKAGKIQNALGGLKDAARDAHKASGVSG